MRFRSIAQLLFGIATFIPGVYNLRAKKIGSGGSYSARYCYSVYLRHMTMAQRNGFSTSPKVIAELGPGDSLGIGLMALLLGAEKYYAFDVVKFSSDLKNLEMLDDLILLLRSQENIPDEKEFPRIQPKLDNCKFPSNIYSKNFLSLSLDTERIKNIKKSIKNNNKMIEYKAPWLEDKNISMESVDLIISQAVLEHIDNLEDAYRIMDRWLKKDGFMSHCIDFKSHGKSSTWDGHWKMPNWYWFLLRGGRPYLINRYAFSYHKKLLLENNFLTVFYDRTISDSTVSDSKLCKQFKSLSKEDRETSSVFIQIKKQ